MSTPVADSPTGCCAFWLEILPTGDHVTVDLVPHRESASVIARVNGDVWRYQWCHNLAEAERLAWEWWDDFPNLLGIGR